jgi:hypothetical protein
MTSAATDRNTSAGPSATSLPYDLFFSAPLSGWAPGRFAAQHQGVLAVVDAVRTAYGLERVYFAGSKLTKSEDFVPKAQAARDDFAAIGSSRRFLLFYPERMVTSTLVEIGYALAAKVPCSVLRHAGAELPYLLRGLAEDGSLMESVYHDDDELFALIAARSVLR